MKNYIMDFREDEKSVVICITNEDIRKKLRASCIYSYDGKEWIKTSGGRAVRTDKLIRLLAMTKTDEKAIKRYFRKGA